MSCKLKLKKTRNVNLLYTKLILLLFINNCYKTNIFSLIINIVEKTFL